MNKLVTVMIALLVASVSGAALAQDKSKAASASADIGGKVAMCIGCHGIPRYQTNFPEVYKVPMISGQNEKYIASALNAYKKGERKHPSMRGIAQSLSDQDIAEIAAYYAASGKDVANSKANDKVPDAPAKVAELIQKGACLSCHGEGFRKPIDPSYPKVAGQYPDYLTAALKAYKVDHEYFGRTNAIMAGVAKQFSNTEIKQIAEYISSIGGDLKTVREPRFR
ncbi:MAG: c-type cytochrome [Burkholderiales bacterium]